MQYRFFTISIADLRLVSALGKHHAAACSLHTQAHLILSRLCGRYRSK